MECKFNFTGKYTFTIDAKHRLFMPADHREELGRGFFVSISMKDPCLRVYPKEVFVGLMNELYAIENKSEELQDTISFINNESSAGKLDSQGRVVIPDNLVSFAELEKNIMIVGCGNYFEIWSAEIYNAIVAAKMEEKRRMAREVFKMVGI